MVHVLASAWRDACMGQGGACKETDNCKGSCSMDMLQLVKLALRDRLQTGVQGGKQGSR